MKETQIYFLAMMAFIIFSSNDLLANDEAIDVLNNKSKAIQDECLTEYKKCTTSILDKVDAFYKVYENKGEECIKNIQTIIDSEYEHVSCQDQLSRCRGENESIWSRIHHTNDIQLEIGSPDKHGLNKFSVKSIREQARQIPKLKSLLISRKNKLIFEEYYRYKDDPKPHHVWSITKSVMSLLIGIAIDNNFLESEEESIKPYFSNHFKNESDPRKEDILIKHALTMTTGLNFTDNNNWYDWSSYEPYARDDNARDWILNYEMLLNYQPGDVWLYGSPNTDLLSTIISSSTNLSTLEFAEKYLFAPLEINNYIWWHDSSENYVGGFTLFLRPRALMRIGQMVSNGGRYQGKQIVSENWINKSLSSFVELGGEDGFAYGYSWWRFRVGENQVISAFGYGGQLITLIPSLDLIIVTTSDSNSACSKESVEKQFGAVLDLARSVIMSIDMRK